MVKKIAVCVATYKRKLLLKNFLNSIKRLKIPKKYKLQVILVVNDSESYNKIIKIFKKLNIKVLYERQKGISYARNKYLKEIRKGKFDYVAFFDDDCTVENNWIISMLNLMNNQKADIIAGPQYIRSKSLFNNILIRNELHLKKISWASTNNVFLKSSVLKNNLKFSNKLNLIGGEDQLFFLSLKKYGFKIIWNKFAKVFEEKNKSKENFIWFLKRNLRYGASATIIYRSLYGYVIGTGIVILKFLLDLFKSVINFFLIIKFSKENLLKSIMYLTRSIGSLLGLIGIQIKEYA